MYLKQLAAILVIIGKVLSKNNIKNCRSFPISSPRQNSHPVKQKNQKRISGFDDKNSILTHSATSGHTNVLSKTKIAVSDIFLYQLQEPFL